MQQNLQHNQEAEILSPISDFSEEQPQKRTTFNSMNFVKSLRKGLQTKIIALYEESPFTIHIVNLQHLLNKQKQQKQSEIFDINTQNQQNVCEIIFESVPYDCLQISPNIFIASCKGMPVRIYQSIQNKPKHISTIVGKKKNSQAYLSPIQMAWNKNNPTKILGGGNKFVSIYDITQNKQESMFKNYDKSNVSAVQFLDQNTAIIGTFQGSLSIFDIRSPSEPEPFMRPHVDAVTTICSNPKYPIFATGARKDNFTYIWDLRNFDENSMYSKIFQEQNNTNQRIGFSFDQTGKYLCKGSQKGEVNIWNVNAEGENAQNFRVSVGDKSGVVNSVVGVQENVVFSAGTRTFQQFRDSDDQMDGQRNKKSVNKIGYFSLPL